MAGAGTGGVAGSATGGTAGSAGGTGGTAGSGTGGTAGGTSSPCNAPQDCPGPDNECTLKLCENYLCQVTFVDPGTPTNAQASGDCQRFVCDGEGTIIQTPDDGDLPDDSNPCTVDRCTAGVPSNTKLTAGEPCGDKLKCDADGHCIGCTEPADCGGPDPCFTWTCTNNQCGRELRLDGTACGVCQACKAGQCANVESGLDPNDDCAQAPPCGTDGTCDGGGACRFFPNGQPCGAAPSCTAGVAVLQDRCDGGGSCLDAGTKTCSPYRCKGAACATTCNQMGDCDFGYVCASSECVDCLLCGEWYANPTLTTLQACPTDSAALIQALKGCACGAMGNTGSCANECAGNGNLCSVNPGSPTAQCDACVESDCTSQRNSCLEDQ